MRLKTFIATYLLFLCILYASLGIVSVYMTNSQTALLKEKSVAEYHSIAATLSKDIAVLQSRNADTNTNTSAVISLIDGYIHYYGRYNIKISVTGSSLSSSAENSFADTEVSFIRQEHKHYIRITGLLPHPSSSYRLDYSFDITKNVADMQSIQNTLLIFAITFSMLTAIVLYFILSSIFKPLGIVADASRKIADGQYSERLLVKGKDELSRVALSFNRMSEEIEKQMRVLADEAIVKQQYADDLAHEIRTPLTSIYGYAEYIQKASLSEEEIIESAQYIMTEAGHMNKIANSLLELATLRNYSPVKRKVCVPRLFDDISRTMEKTLHEHGVQIVCRPDAGVIYGQEDLIKSLLINLCDNAVKSCAAIVGEIRLMSETQDDKTVLSVADNGCGIPDESMVKITEPFYRVDKSRSREHGGAGLGLTICKQIVEAHDAEMTVESVVGMGTTVKITFTSS